MLQFEFLILKSRGEFWEKQIH